MRLVPIAFGSTGLQGTPVFLSFLVHPSWGLPQAHSLLEKGLTSWVGSLVWLLSDSEPWLQL